MRSVLGALVLAGLLSWSARPAAGTSAVAPAPVRQPTPALSHLVRADGFLPAASRLTLSVVLPSRDPLGLAALAAAVSEPGSGSYHRYLGKAQFAARFGALPAVEAEVKRELDRSGLDVVSSPSDHLSLTVTGSAARVESAFSVQLERAHLDGRLVYLNSGAATLPAGASAVLGLDDLDQARDVTSFAWPAPKLDHPAQGPAGAYPGQAYCPVAGSGLAYTPAEVDEAYGVNTLDARGLSGAGQTVASFELADYSDQDVSGYSACFGGSDADVTRVDTDGGAAIGDGTSEATADIETLLGFAPSVHVLVYEAPNSDAGEYDNYAAIVSQDRAQIIATSWGECEAMMSKGLAPAENALFQEAAVQGQTVLAAAGDSGSEDCYVPGMVADDALAVDNPASQPYVTSVGGTSLTSVSPREETVWNDSGGAGGGGISQNWPMPDYQRPGVGPLSSGGPCGVSQGWCREVPDVSALADTSNGYWIYCNAGDCAGSQWVPVGGTSLGPPLWASLVALSNQACSSGAAGFLNPTLYADAATATNDITGGNNDFLGLHGVYPAGPGYDMASGLGTPNAPGLIQDLCAATPPLAPSPGYRLAGSDGGIFDFGTAAFDGSTGSLKLNRPIVGMAGTPDGRGYWLVASDGGVFSFGDAGFHGSTAGLRLTKPIVGMAGTPDGRGYWLVTSGGGVFSFGNAGFHGSANDAGLTAPVVGMAPDPETGGYWMVTAAGQVLAFDAPRLGSATHVTAPIVAMAASPDGAGYRLTGSDGNVYAIGDASDLGSVAGKRLSRRVVGIVDTPDGFGYWLVAAGGGVFSFGNARYLGSTGDLQLNRPIVGMTATG